MSPGAMRTRRSFLAGTSATIATLLVAGCSTTPEADPNDPLRATLNGTGATFPKTFYEVAAYEFMKKHRRVTLTYGGGGSGKGRTDLQAQVVDWAGTDAVVKDADLGKYQGGPLLYFPTVVAPITLAYNVAGVRELRLSPGTIAAIFQRRITEWAHPAITAENPEQANRLVGPISVVHRSDGSGTTENFTRFLDKSAGTAAGGPWQLGSGSTVAWPAGTQAGNGNAGVTQLVSDTKGAIGYADYSDAVATELRFAAVKNAAGRYVAPTLAGASAAAEGAPVDDALRYDPLWTSGADAYPITAPTWILVYAHHRDAAKADALRAFLHFVLTDAQALAETVDYAPLPATIVARAIAQLDRIVVT